MVEVMSPRRAQRLAATHIQARKRAVARAERSSPPVSETRQDSSMDQRPQQRILSALQDRHKKTVERPIRSKQTSAIDTLYYSKKTSPLPTKARNGVTPTKSKGADVTPDSKYAGAMRLQMAIGNRASASAPGTETKKEITSSQPFTERPASPSTSNAVMSSLNNSLMSKLSAHKRSNTIKHKREDTSASIEQITSKSTPQNGSMGESGASEKSRRARSPASFSVARQIYKPVSATKPTAKKDLKPQTRSRTPSPAPKTRQPYNPLAAKKEERPYDYAFRSASAPRAQRMTPKKTPEAKPSEAESTQDSPFMMSRKYRMAHAKTSPLQTQRKAKTKVTPIQNKSIQPETVTVPRAETKPLREAQDEPTPEDVPVSIPQTTTSVPSSQVDDAVLVQDTDSTNEHPEEEPPKPVSSTERWTPKKNLKPARNAPQPVKRWSPPKKMMSMEEALSSPPPPPPAGLPPWMQQQQEKLNREQKEKPTKRWTRPSPSKPQAGIDMSSPSPVAEGPSKPARRWTPRSKSAARGEQAKDEDTGVPLQDKAKNIADRYRAQSKTPTQPTSNNFGRNKVDTGVPAVDFSRSRAEIGHAAHVVVPSESTSKDELDMIMDLLPKQASYVAESESHPAMIESKGSGESGTSSFKQISERSTIETPEKVSVANMAGLFAKNKTAPRPAQFRAPGRSKSIEPWMRPEESISPTKIDCTWQDQERVIPKSPSQIQRCKMNVNEFQAPSFATPSLAASEQKKGNQLIHPPSLTPPPPVATTSETSSDEETRNDVEESLDMTYHDRSEAATYVEPPKPFPRPSPNERPWAKDMDNLSPRKWQKKTKEMFDSCETSVNGRLEEKARLMGPQQRQQPHMSLHQMAADSIHAVDFDRDITLRRNPAEEDSGGEKTFPSDLPPEFISGSTSVSSEKTSMISTKVIPDEGDKSFSQVSSRESILDEVSPKESLLDGSGITEGDSLLDANTISPRESLLDAASPRNMPRTKVFQKTESLLNKGAESVSSSSEQSGYSGEGNKKPTVGNQLPDPFSVATAAALEAVATKKVIRNQDTFNPFFDGASDDVSGFTDIPFPDGDTNPFAEMTNNNRISFPDRQSFSPPGFTPGTRESFVAKVVVADEKQDFMKLAPPSGSMNDDDEDDKELGGAWDFDEIGVDHSLHNKVEI